MAQANIGNVTSKKYRITCEEETIIAAGEGVLSSPPPGLISSDAIVIHEPVDQVAEAAKHLASSIEEAGFRVLGLRSCGGESCKSIEWIVDTWRWLAQANASRATTVFILGGGALLDAAGFAAATFMRGLPTVLVPTTTLSAFDAAVGGKTAVNLEGKNVVGAFHNPRAVLVEPRLLASLPERPFKSGFAEAVKHSLLSGWSDMKFLESVIGGALARSPESLSQLALWSLGFKMSIVVKDPREGGLRRILNLGHTIGHVVEAASRYSLTHGEAVAAGLIAELMLAEEETGLDSSVTRWTANTIDSIGLPRSPPEKVIPSILANARRLLLLDKKRVGETIVMPLLREPGDVVLARVSIGRILSLIEVAWG